MSARALVTLAVCLSLTKLQNTHGESIAFGKLAKQRNSYPGYPASRALNAIYSTTGSFTYLANPCWWEVDLRGYFDISNITLTAATNGWGTYMSNAYVEVIDKDVSLCSDAQVEWCGNVSSTVAAGEEFTFTCNATFPVRFVRVTRRSTSNTFLNIGHIDVQGVGATKRYRSYYTPTTGRKVTKPSMTTSAITAGECGILCHRNHSCIDFSYSKTASTESNCLLTYEVVPQYSVARNDWTMYTMDNCL
ncbi:uncharacterized protein LOC124271655 [Haliotis rubra]|uniref:uncharacterized protein LOC124271655 n=1 Tax=Haliotis rubra TaxID=36100 RepID=UPI001EE577BF|nr:uncharacterized protein LOC124271655 [Haliotis rubra]